MRRMFALLVAALVLGPLLAPPPTYAWPDRIEAFITALGQGDAPAALAALPADATLALPLELLPPDSAVAPAGVRAANARLTLTGREQIGAWLDEFLTRHNGRVYTRSGAQVRGAMISVQVTVQDDYLRDLGISWVYGTLEFTMPKEQLTGVGLSLPAETLQQLRRANPQVYATARPVVHAGSALME